MTIGQFAARDSSGVATQTLMARKYYSEILRSLVQLDLERLRRRIAISLEFNLQSILGERHGESNSVGADSRLPTGQIENPLSASVYAEESEGLPYGNRPAEVVAISKGFRAAISTRELDQ